MFGPVLLPAMVSTAIGGAAWLVTVSSRSFSQKERFKTSGARLEPVLLDAERANWAQAPVHRTPLLIRYRDPASGVMEGIIHPKTIMGQRVPARGIRPDTVNAFCQTRQSMCSFDYEHIIWAADAQSGELIEDLYHYLGGAQPGGAPSPLYAKTAAVAGTREWKRHW